MTSKPCRAKPPGLAVPGWSKFHPPELLYHESEFVCPQAGPLRCGRSHLRGALHGIAAVLLRRSAGARGRGSLPAARVRPGVHRRCRAGLLPGKPAGFHHRGRHLRHTGHSASLPCDLQAAESPLQGAGSGGFAAAGALQRRHHRH